MVTFKYSIGQIVILWDGECYSIDQKQVMYGLPYYRLEGGRVVSEDSVFPFNQSR